MEESLLDTSWTIHYIAHSSSSYRSLFTSKIQSNQAQDDRYADRLTNYLSTHTPQYTDELDDERERLGVLRECKWTNLTLTPSSTINPRIAPPSLPAIHIQLTYQKQTYKFLLLSTIILFKSASTHQKRVFDFLSDTFAILVDGPLRLSSDLLLAGLQDFIHDLTPNSSCDDSDDDDDNDERDSETVPDEDTRLAILKSGIGTLKMTITFTAAEVAKSLRSVDLDVPYETVYALISTDEYTPAATNGVGGRRKSSFLEKLQRHIREKTGLVLPLTISSSSPITSSSRDTPNHSQNDNHNQNTTDTNNINNTSRTTIDKSQLQNQPQSQSQSQSILSNSPPQITTPPPFRLSKLTTSSFALTTEGRIKFSTRATESTTDEYAMIIKKADLKLLRRIMRVAETRK